MRHTHIAIGYAIVLACFSTTALAQTTIGAADLPLKSSGVAHDAAWTLDANGYVGTYIKLDAAAQVTLAVRASGKADGGAVPRMNIVVADTRRSFNVADQPADYTATVSLPAGMFVARIDFANDSPTADRALTIHSLSVTGAIVVKDHTDANALAVADTYIDNYRKGAATVTLQGASAGTQVQVKLKRHAFNFGTVIPEVRTNTVLIGNPPPDSDAHKFQQYINAHFNMLVPGNAGKWSSNEAQRGVITMDYADTICAYAKRHNMRLRMHTLLWNDEQTPQWAQELLSRAVEGDERAKKDLRQAISDRIKYYVRDRAANYAEMDVLNESLHKPWFWCVYGAAGMADIHNEAAKAVADAGANTLLFTNEFNILQWSSNPITRQTDNYANWYRENVEAIMQAGGVVGGIGVQYYADNGANAKENRPHSAARILQVLQNLSVTGLPITLTEFGVQRGREPTGGPEQAAQILQESLRMVFGTDRATGFIVWGIRKPWLWDQADQGALLDDKWQPTPAGQRFEHLMSQWSTDVTATVDAAGKINFTGFYGDYDLTVGGKTYPLTLLKDTQQYAVSVAP